MHSLAIKEKVFGSNNPDVAQALNNLAGLYRAQGRYGDAEPLYKRSLAMREKSLGPDRSEVAESLNNLGALYEVQARFAEAEPLYKRSLAIREKVLGPDRPDVAILNGLSRSFGHRSSSLENLKSDDALSRALEIFNRLLSSSAALHIS